MQLYSLKNRNCTDMKFLDSEQSVGFTMLVFLVCFL